MTGEAGVEKGVKLAILMEKGVIIRTDLKY
jgi:hypothetical protein